MLAILAVLAQADPYRDCLADIDHGAMVKSQTLDCATAAMDRADAALNARYHVAMRALPPRRRVVLRLEERRWIAERRARCAIARQAAIPSPKINRMLCLVRETEARTAYLDRLR